MPRFGRTSRERLATVHPDLQDIFEEVVKKRDCIVLYLGGHRDQETQERLFKEGKSKVRWPDSKHNKNPSHAIDVAPYFAEPPHVRWNDSEAFYHFAGYVMRVADEMEIPLRWGGDWDGDLELHDQTFMDLVHFELR